MKNYTITVNGNIYDVTVEENTGAAQSKVQKTAPAAPVILEKTPVTASAPASPGGTKVTAGASGKVLTISVSEGDQIESGTTVAVLEIMKMETPVVSSRGGTVVSIDVSVGDMIETGAAIVTLN